MAASKSRLKRVEAALAKQAATVRRAATETARDVCAAYFAEAAEWLVRHAPEMTDDEDDAILRPILDRMADPNSPNQDCLASWRSYPLARWAMPLPEGFTFPRALLEFLADPPHDYFFGHSCEQCGLHVPICTFWDGKTGPPHNIRPFAVCPACAGTTSFAANWQTGPKADPR